MPFNIEPIQEVVARLASEDSDVVDAGMKSCLSRIDEAAPLLRAYLLDVPADETEASILLAGLHVLAASRDAASFAPLLLLLEQPESELDWIFGDVITETLSKIVASLFNGDERALFHAIRRPEQDVFVRNALLGAATFLTRDGRIDRATMAGFLTTFAFEPHLDETNWAGWIEAVGLLGLSSLRSRAEWAFSTGAATEDMYDLAWLDERIATATANPSDSAPFERCGLGYIDDPVKALSWSKPSTFAQQSASIPTRDTGRNDPCPCGSGRKFKKCCINTF